MWFSFWRSRDRFSLDELRYLTEQLQKVQIVNEVNKDFVIEALRSIAELITYGDQNDPSFFEFFMEKQIMGEFVRFLRISKPMKVSLQLLQTMSIMIQNLRSDHAIYYIFSNEHINFLISYSFDFTNDELLSYYISFLRAISGKLNQSTISLLMKTHNNEIVAFPLYVEAIRFAFHEETMVRIAVRALTLNVYHVGDAAVNKFVATAPLSDYFVNLINYIQRQCVNLDELASQASKNMDLPESTSSILTAIDELEDSLYYLSDVLSSGIPDLGRLISDNILSRLVFPLLLPAFKKENVGGQVGLVTSLYLLCCILHIVKTMDLSSIICCTLFYRLEAFPPKSAVIQNGTVVLSEPAQVCKEKNGFLDSLENESCRASVLNTESSSPCSSPHCTSTHDTVSCPSCTLRELLLSYITAGDNMEVLGSLSLLATLLQTKELDESMLDGLGILPQRRQHKKLLLKALLGEGLAEQQLFSSENSCGLRDDICNELDRYLQRLREQYGLFIGIDELGINPLNNRHQVLDALVYLFCRPSISAETLWVGGWLLRQLLPHGEEEFTTQHLSQLKDSYQKCASSLIEEIKGSWCDMLYTVITDEWRNCKKAIEAPSTPKDPKTVLLPSQMRTLGDSPLGESCSAAGEKMHEVVKVFVLQCQLLFFSYGRSLPDQPLVDCSINSPSHSHAKAAGLNALVPKTGTEVNLADAVPCRIAFERGKERHFCFLVVTRGMSGWILLAEQLPLKLQYGVIRVTAPLAGANPRIDEKHPKWLHLRIRSSSLPSSDQSKHNQSSKGRAKVVVDGRWTLAFRDEEACKTAETMIIEETEIQRREVEKTLKPLLDLDLSTKKNNPLETSNFALKSSCAEAAFPCVYGLHP